MIVSYQMPDTPPSRPIYVKISSCEGIKVGKQQSLFYK